MIQLKFGSILAISAASLLPLAAAAQQPANPGWFVPGQQRPAAPAGNPAPRAPAPLPAAPSMAPGFVGDATGAGDNQGPPRQLQVQLPPMPEIPPVEKSAPPPAPVIGVLSVPDVLRFSVAYQAFDKEMNARKQRLNEDAQKEQVALRDLGQALGRDRAKMRPEEIRAKEREYEDRVNESRRKFAERGRIIQEAAQYGIAQIDRTLEAITQQVSVARGVTLVLNKAQLIGTSGEFDLTPQVVDVLNKILPSVVVPPEGVSVVDSVKANPAGPGSIAAAPEPREPAPLVLPASPAPTPPPAAAAPAPAKPPRKP